VRVLEQAPVLRDQGAGIQISPNGWRVLRALGLADTLAGQSPRAKAVQLRDFRTGRAVFDTPLDGPDQVYHFVHRADLQKALADACRNAGVEIRLDQAVSQITANADITEIGFADGRTEYHGVTLAADGVKSVARGALNPKLRPYFTGQTAWRAVVPSDTALPNEAHVFMGPGRHLVRYPLRDGHITNIIAVMERDTWAAQGWNHKDDPKNLRRAFVDFCPEIRDLLAMVTDVHLWGLFRYPVAPVWHGGHLALLGDAAHPTLPFMAQGANMALEDAYTIAQCLADHNDITTAFAKYQNLRQMRCARIVQAADQNAQNYHLRPGPMRWAAHTALRMAGRFAPHVITRRFDWIYRHDVTQGHNADGRL
jgi:salicylate hydroxylase